VRALRRVCLEEIVLSASNFPEPTARGVRAMSFESFLASIEAPALREVAAYWQEARGSRRMPGWKDIDPAAIARHLPIVWSWRYDRHADTFTGRLAGEEITEVFGKSLRGVPMREFFADWQYDLIFARHRRVVTEPAFAHGAGPVFIHAGRSGMGERVILSLANDGILGDGILGATVYGMTPSERRSETLRVEPAQETVAFFPLD